LIGLLVLVTFFDVRRFVLSQ